MRDAIVRHAPPTAADSEPRARHVRWLLVAIFAIGMAWVEAATVYYLRTMVDRVVPYQQDPLPIRGDLGQVELWREAATLLMLAAVGALAGKGWQTRAGYTAIAFGVWDIFYYVFLRIMSGWPTSVLDWDVLFLLPLPWWGPVLAPVCISLLLIAWGTIVTQARHGSHSWLSPVWGFSVVGIALALYVFMADALHALAEGTGAVMQVLPASFNWPLFLLSLTLMGAPLAQAFLRSRGFPLAQRRSVVR